MHYSANHQTNRSTNPTAVHKPHSLAELYVLAAIHMLVKGQLIPRLQIIEAAILVLYLLDNDKAMNFELLSIEHLSQLSDVILVSSYNSMFSMI